MPYYPDQILVTTLKNTTKWHGLMLLCSNWQLWVGIWWIMSLHNSAVLYESPTFSLWVLQFF